MARTAARADGPVFITGGSSGIGLAIAVRMAREGHDLALFARDSAKLESARRMILAEAAGVRVETFACDVGERAACSAAIAQAIGSLGAPAWAIANAGIAKPGRFLEQPLDDHEAQLRANYLGSLYFAHSCAAAMAIKGGGRLVFVASGAAFFGIYGYAAYAPSKFAVRGLAEVLRVELAPAGISVTLAYPPDTDTPQLAAEQATKPAATKAITAGGGLFPAGRVASAILDGAARGRFIVAPGMQMKLLSASHSLIAPALRLWQAGLVRRHP